MNHPLSAEFRGHNTNFAWTFSVTGPRSDLYLCKTRCQREIDTTDRQIDQLVYELYGLTEEEIRIVESENKSK